jgi:hypothetical protein
VDFLVTPPEATGWRIDAGAFAAALRARWPGAEVRICPGDDPVYALDFTVHEAGARVDGSLSRDGQMLGLAGALEEVLPLAVWFRGLVEPRQGLLFYDPALDGQVALVPGASAEDVARGYRSDAA